jgi:hypothetical protein
MPEAAPGCRQSSVSLAQLGTSNGCGDRKRSFRLVAGQLQKETPSDVRLGVASNEVNRRNYCTGRRGLSGGRGLAQSPCYVI